MKIEQNRIVALSYTLKSDGDVIETVTTDKPMEFMYGIGYLLPKFEEHLQEKAVGDSFDFILKAADAYGEFDESAVVELPKDIFQVDGEFDEEMVQVGNQIPMQDSDGNRLQGIVEAIDDTTVTMNFNHPLAGSDLHFTGAVVSVREATPEDLAGGSCGCGCSSGGCSSSNEGCGCDDDGCGCNGTKEGGCDCGAHQE